MEAQTYRKEILWPQNGEVRSIPSPAEQKLLFAVLEDAIKCYLRGFEDAPLRNSPEFIAAKMWLRSDKKSDPFSFTKVCEALDIDPGRLRAGVISHGRSKHALPPLSSAREVERTASI